MKTLFVLFLLSGFIYGMEPDKKIDDKKEKETCASLRVSIPPQSNISSKLPHPDFPWIFQNSPDDRASYQEWAAFELVSHRPVSNLD